MGLKNNMRCLFLTFFLICSFNNFGITNSSNLDHTSGHFSSKGKDSCDHVKLEFPDITIEDGYSKGKVCGGQCCFNETEIHLKLLARTKFKTQIEHHTKNLQSFLENAVDKFQSHLLELVYQSHNKSVNVFSMVYPSKLSKQILHNLYSTIIGIIKSNDPSSNWINKRITDTMKIDDTLDTFFINLFPIAYHKAVYSSKPGEFHMDYVNCLKHAYKDQKELEPFGSVSKDLNLNLKTNLMAASDFTNGLLESAKVLSDINKIDASLLSETCQNQLLKMTYCPICNGMSKANVRTCHSYCLNIMRGCLAQLGFTELDHSWAKVADAIENLVSNYIQSQNGVLKSIKNIDNILSTAIMNIMNKGGELERTVTQICGPASFVSIEENKHQNKHQTKLDVAISSSDYLPELLSFLTTISNSKQFYTNIVNSLCSDDHVKNTDIHCWTGDHIGDYSYTTLMPGGAQKYNPEVPLAKDNLQDSLILHELVDRFFKISSNIGSGLNAPITRYSDIQGDMAESEEEGSGQFRSDDEDVGHSGSGDDNFPETESPSSSPESKVIANNGNSFRCTNVTIQSLVLILLLYFIFLH